MAARQGRSIDEILASIMEGKDDHSQIIETLKTVARSAPATRTADESQAIPALEETAAGGRFLCPVCETVVEADATVCPGCGAKFSEGEATEYECPVCHASVPEDATRCPSCGVRFAEEGTEPEDVEEPRVATTAPSLPSPPPRIPLQTRIEQMRRSRREADIAVPTGDRKLLYRELPKLVNEVKPLLVSAKRIGLEIEEGKRLINDAIQAGKGRDIERAVELIAKARKALDVAFVDSLGGQIDSFITEIQAAKGDAALSAILPRLQQAVNRLEKAEYDAAWELYEGALSGFRSDAKEYHDARSALEEGERTVRDVKALGMDVRDAERLLQQARDALGTKNVSTALRLSTQARDRLRHDVPRFVQEEMRKARNALLDLKMRGNDLGKPIGILKEASAHMKDEKWGDAVRYIKDFYREIETIR